MCPVLSFQWGPENRPQEDALLRDDERGIFLVADGVTRTPGPQGYPDPSPAKQAADALLHAVHKALQDLPFAPGSFSEACRIGNQHVKELNQRLGVWEHLDYWEHDLAGAVFAGAWLRNNELLWTFLTDCGVATLSPTGAILWETPDRLAPAKQHFPDLPTEKEIFVTIRRDFRNRPARGLDRTYGVFTGEDEALQYLEVSSRTIFPGEVVLVFTDGIRPLMSNAEFRALLCNRATAEIQNFVLSSPQNQPKTDKTLIVIRTA